MPIDQLRVRPGHRASIPRTRGQLEDARHQRRRLLPGAGDDADVPRLLGRGLPAPLRLERDDRAARPARDLGLDLHRSAHRGAHPRQSGARDGSTSPTSTCARSGSSTAATTSRRPCSTRTSQRPIETVEAAGTDDNISLTFINAESAEIYGVELEWLKGLGFIRRARHGPTRSSSRATSRCSDSEITIGERRAQPDQQRAPDVAALALGRQPAARVRLAEPASQRLARLQHVRRAAVLRRAQRSARCLRAAVPFARPDLQLLPDRGDDASSCGFRTCSTNSWRSSRAG